MNYNQIKDFLYQSEIIQKIPDKWQQAPTFMCKYNDNLYDVFVFYNEYEKIEIKVMILIDANTGEILSFTQEEIKNVFSVSKLTFGRKTISDYNLYFTSKQEYEKLYLEYHDKMISANKIEEYGEYMRNLYIGVINEDFYNEVILPVINCNIS